MRLSAEHPRDALARDEALLDEVGAGNTPRVRWYVATAPAVVLGLGLRHRLHEIVDLERCQRAGIQVIERRAGGGVVLLDAHMLCCAVCVPLPHPRVSADLTESYRWLGDHFAWRLRSLGVSTARRVEVDEARADVAQLRAADADPIAKVLLATCYGALSPHEVIAAGNAKLVGIAQVRRRHAALFQAGLLLRDQSRLADLLRVPDAATREHLRAALGARSVGLADALGSTPDPRVVVRTLEEALLLLESDELA